MTVLLLPSFRWLVCAMGHLGVRFTQRGGRKGATALPSAAMPSLPPLLPLLNAQVQCPLRVWRATARPLDRPEVRHDASGPGHVHQVRCLSAGPPALAPPPHPRAVHLPLLLFATQFARASFLSALSYPNGHGLLRRAVAGFPDPPDPFSCVLVQAGDVPCLQRGDAGGDPRSISL